MPCRELRTRLHILLALATSMGTSNGVDAGSGDAAGDAAATASVCDGVDPFGPAEFMLEGKHLEVLDYEWPGFAAKDATAPHGWVGFDVDLLSAIATRLGFTFTIREMAQRTGESWSDMLTRSVSSSDLILSYWGRSPAKINTMAMLAGHIDYSSVLVVKRTTQHEEPLLDRVLKFALPFSLEAWLTVVLLIVCSGVVDYLLERQQGGTIGSSIYEYFAGVMWGGFQEPRSRLSAVYQVILGFILMIVVAAYTANLAAFMTVSSLPSLGIASLEELILANEPACVRTGDPNQALYESSLATGLLYEKIPYEELDVALRSGACQAAITPRQNYETWKADGRNCELGLAGGSLLFSSAGWITSVNASRCVQRPIEMMIQQLTDEGVLRRLQWQWVQPARCLVDEEVQPQPQPIASGRRLAREASSAFAPDAWEEGMSEVLMSRPARPSSDTRSGTREAKREDARMRLGWSTAHAQHDMHVGASSSRHVSRGRRQLKVGTNGAGDTGTGAGATSTSMNPQLDAQLGLTDFLGIVIMWVLATASILGVRICQHARARREKLRRAHRATERRNALLSDADRLATKLQSLQRGRKVRQKKTAGLLMIDTMFGVKTSEAPAFNSDGAALRHLVSEMHFVREYVAAQLELTHANGRGGGAAAEPPGAAPRDTVLSPASKSGAAYSLAA